MSTATPPTPGRSRRAFLGGACAGAGATARAFGAPWAWRALRDAGPAAPPRAPAAAEGMPGPYPGRVVEVHHPGSVRPDASIDRAAVAAMMERGLCALTGAEHVSEAWRRFFAKGDVVGVKVNPVGHADGRPGRSSISSPA